MRVEGQAVQPAPAGFVCPDVRVKRKGRVAIADGDTLTVLTASRQQHEIRLAEIDAPEKSQPFGTKSKQSLSDLCFGKEAEVRPRATDHRFCELRANNLF